jgi:thiol:disulfide interchange protein DsbD
MVRILVYCIIFCVTTFSAGAQIEKHVKWETSVNQKDCDAELIIKAIIDPKWHIYSQYTPDGGPLPTEFQWETNKNYKLIGKTSEPKPHVHFDKIFETEVWDFDGTVIFKQKIKVLSKSDFDIKLNISYQTCDDSKCIFEPDNTFTFKIKGSANCSSENINNPGYEHKINRDTNNTLNNNMLDKEVTIKPVSWKIFTKKYSESNYELILDVKIKDGYYLFAPKAPASEKIIPLNIKFNLTSNITLNGSTVFPKTSDTIFNSLVYPVFKNSFSVKQKITLLDADSSTLKNGINVTINYCVLHRDKILKLNENLFVQVNLLNAEADENSDLSDSYWVIFITAFLSGFLALLTPCVFPMIPMTVSYFLKSSKNKSKGIRNASLYGFFIIFIYVFLGLLITTIYGADSLNALSTNIYFNLFFFVLLIVFALSFLGAFEIVLPSAWINAADKNADRGGILGIFFMAFTLALVSFSCTGPIVGTLLVKAATDGGLAPFFGMLGFSLAIALPFTLFAIFPGWLNSMPQSGGWLNTVKVSLGFLELAFAFKFLSNADLVINAHLLEREIFLSIWLVIFALWGFYMLGKIKLSHDADLPYVSTIRIILSVFIFSFVVYLIPGLWGAPLKLISGFPPPLHYSESPFGIGGRAPETILPEHAEHGPHGLVVFHDLQYALKYSEKIQKPVMIDFTGWACVNCRQMEERVWSDENVLKLLQNEVIIASLYVDEKNNLPQPEVSPFTGKTLKTVGQKWSEYQREKHKSNSQPMYLMVDQNENILNGYASFQSHGKVDDFKSWLTEGINRYKERLKIKEINPAMYYVQD